MPGKCKKLLPWLIRNLDERLADRSKGILGLEWEDRRKGLFWLPWPRQKNRGWQPSVSRLFLEYNILQNEDNENEEPNYVMFKTRLRTALNKDSCLEEITHRHRIQEKQKLFQITDSRFIKEVAPRGASSRRKLQETVPSDEFCNESPSSSSSFSSETSSLSLATTSEASDSVQALLESFTCDDFSMLNFEIQTTELENLSEYNEIFPNSQLTEVGVSAEDNENLSEYNEISPNSQLTEVGVSAEDNENQTTLQLENSYQLHLSENSPLAVPYEY